MLCAELCPWAYLSLDLWLGDCLREAQRPEVRRKMLIPSPGAVGWLCSSTKSYILSGGYQHVTCCLPGLSPCPRPRVVRSDSAVSSPSATAPLLFSLKSVHPVTLSSWASGTVPSRLCQSLSDYDTQHSNSLFRNHVCACLLKLQTQTLFQSHLSCLLHEQMKFPTGWSRATSDEDLQSPPV